jgi:hypothetical protein
MLHTGRIGSMHFVTQKQRQMIEGHGQAVAVFPVLQCACLLEDQQFSPICRFCEGTGRYYPSAISYATTLLLTQDTSERSFNDPGTWFSGQVRASVLPGIHLAERDKVRMVDIAAVANDEVLYRGLDDTLRHRAVVEIEVVADHVAIYSPTTDYSLHAPNTVAWRPGGHAPAPGEKYSVRYRYHPEFLVVNDMPRLRVEHRTPQSQEVLLMRLDALTEQT